MNRSLAVVALAAPLALSAPQIALAPPAHAQAAPLAGSVTAPVTADGAKELAALLTRELPVWLFGASPDARLEWKGETLATPDGAGYKIALAPFHIVATDGGRVEVGSVRLGLTPQADGAWAFSGVLPGAVTFHDGMKLTATLTIGRQSIEGVWAPAYMTATKARLDFGDVVLDDAASDGKLAIGGLTFSQTLVAGANGAYAGAVEMSDMRINDDDGRALAEVGTLRSDIAMNGIDMARFAAINSMQLDAARTGAQPDPRLLLEALRGLADSVSMNLAVAGMMLYDKTDDTRVTADGLETGFSVNGLNQPLAGGSFRFAARGLGAIEGVAPPDVMPQAVDVSISLAKAPTALLSAMLAENAPADPFATAMADLTQAGTELTLDRLVLETAQIKASAAGIARVAAGAPHGAVGEVTATVEGLDAFAKALRQNPGPETQETMGIVAMLQTMGQRERGKDARTYHVEVTADGGILLNGADLMPLLGMPSGVPEDEPMTKRKQ